MGDFNAQESIATEAKLYVWQGFQGNNGWKIPPNGDLRFGALLPPTASVAPDLVCGLIFSKAESDLR